MTRWHGIDYRNDTTVVTLYDTETSDVLIWFPNSSQYLEQPSQMPDFFMMIIEQLLFRIS